MLIVDMSEVKLPGKAKQNNLPPECRQPIEVGEVFCIHILVMFLSPKSA
jgi:hypothetical protein